MRMVTLCGFCTPSTNVYFSSPSTCSYTAPACPSASGDSSSTLLIANPARAILTLNLYPAKAAKSLSQHNSFSPKWHAHQHVNACMLEASCGLRTSTMQSS